MRALGLLACATVALAAQGASAQGSNTSALWGKEGELWSGPAGRLPDYSYAGYHRGEKPIPNVPVTSNVKNYGAQGNGVADDTQAFKNAIANAPNGALLIPAGKYVLSDVLRIKRSNLVLRGEGDGPGGTELFFTQPLNTLKPAGSIYWNQGKSGLVVVGSSVYDGDNTVLGPKYSNVVVPALRGDDSVVVGNAGALKPGMTVYLRMRDDAGGTMNWYLNNDLFPGGTCSWDPAPFEWPVEIAAVSGNVVTFVQPLRFDVRLQWKPEIYEYVEYEEVGIEHLRVSFPLHAYPGHHLEEGYNAIAFEGMLNSWVRDVTLHSFDNGIVFELSKNCTISGVDLLKGIDDPFTKDFHHGIWFNRGSADCLLESFSISNADGEHDVSVAAYANGNVVRGGVMLNGKLDHHQGAAFANLFTDLYMGASPDYVWTSGGGSCGSPSSAGFRNTYWNLRSGDPSWVGGAPAAPPWKKVGANIVPAQWNNMTPSQEWLEAVPSLSPGDLYASQLAYRVGGTASVAFVGPGCGPGALSLGASGDPVLGSVITLSASGTPENAVAQLLLGAPLASPFNLGSGCALYFDPTSVVAFPIGFTNVQGQWSTPVFLPPDNSLSGLAVVAQVLFSVPLQPGQTALSSGLKLTLGT